MDLWLYPRGSDGPSLALCLDEEADVWRELKHDSWLMKRMSGFGTRLSLQAPEFPGDFGGVQRRRRGDLGAWDCICVRPEGRRPQRKAEVEKLLRINMLQQAITGRHIDGKGSEDARGERRGISRVPCYFTIECLKSDHIRITS